MEKVLKKAFHIVLGVLVLVVAFLFSSGFPVHRAAELKDNAAETAAEQALEANGGAPVDQQEVSPAPTPSPSPEPTLVPVEEIPEIQVSEEFVIVLEETQGTDGV